MQNELFELFQRNFPHIVRAEDKVLSILGNKENTVIEKRDDSKT